MRNFWFGLFSVVLLPNLLAPGDPICPECESETGFLKTGKWDSFAFNVQKGETYQVSIDPFWGDPDMFLEGPVKSLKCLPSEGAMESESCGFVATADGRVIVEVMAYKTTYFQIAFESGF
jgi:hypothetical protein